MTDWPGSAVAKPQWPGTPKTAQTWPGTPKQSAPPPALHDRAPLKLDAVHDQNLAKLPGASPAAPSFSQPKNPMRKQAVKPGYEGEPGRLVKAGLEAIDVPPDAERQAAIQKYGRVAEAIGTSAREAASVPNAATSALSQLLVDLGLGDKGMTPEQQRDKINEYIGVGLAGAGAEGAPVGAHPAESFKPAEAAKPRVEPPPLSTTPEIARNPEGRPVVPQGGQPPDAAPALDPRAAAAGQEAVRKVAERTAAKPAEQGPWTEWEKAYNTPEAQKALDMQTRSMKAQLAENYYGVAAKPDKFQKQAMGQTNANPTKAAKPALTPKPPPKSDIKPETPLDTLQAKMIDTWYSDMNKEAQKRGLDPTKLSQPARKKRAEKLGFNTNLTLYHGAGAKNIWRLRWKEGDPEPAVFVADDPKVASSYGGSGHLLELWGKMENFKTVDWKGKGFSSSQMSKDIMQAKAEGHDGLIIKNIVDVGSNGKPQTQYAFFKPGNLRSKKAAMFNPKVSEPEAHLLSAAGTPLHELLEQNKREYEAQLPKAPGIVEMAKQGVDTLKTIFAPETLGKDAERAAGSIRKNIGRGVRDVERDKLAMEPFRKTIQQMDTEQQLGVLEWLQAPDKAAQRRAKTAYTFDPPPELAKFLQGFRDLMRKYQTLLESRTKTGDMQFKDDYVTQMWRDPDAARDALHKLGPKEGSNAFTKRSVIEDYAAGIKAGLIPLTTDPIEIAMRYVENVRRYVAINDVLEEGVASKDIVYRTPEHAPNGWVKLDGRAKSFKGGAFEDAYAPPGYAAVYNAFVSKPPTGPWGDLLGAAQKAANSVSAFKLAVSGYHALNIAGEANVAGLANAIDKLAGGDVLGAAKAGVGSPAKFVTSVARGRQMLNTYLTDMGSPKMQKVVQLAVDANFRVAGKGRVADEYRFSAMGSLWDSWRKGRLKAEMQELGKGAAERPLVGSAKAVVSLASRALETLSDPLFKYYIPMAKNGAYFDMMQTWLEKNPQAGAAEQVAFARKAADIIDNRFGEMNQDNIFWQRWQKQLAQTLAVSYSYELGTARSLVGAGKDLAGLARGKGWTPNLSYAIALPLMVGAMGSVYQYLKTGKAPEGLRDAMYPQTGGQDPMSGQPARAVLPSYMSQFVNAYFGGLTHELAGKKNGIFDLLNAAFTGTDWRGEPITAVDDSTTQAIQKWVEYAAGTWTPIIASQNTKGGTNISGGERFAGIREAPMFANDPQGYKRMMDSKRLQQDAEKAWHDRNAELEAKGQHPNFYVKRKFIQNYLSQHKPSYKGTIQ